MLINVDSTIHDAVFLSAHEACAQLGVRRETLYAYASRGLVRSFPGQGKDRSRRYLREDVMRLKARHDARAGHGAVAAGALRWGEPVLDSQLTEITAQGPRYQGELAVDLVARGVPFEAAAELLWTGALPEKAPSWRPAQIPAEDMMRTAARAKRPVGRLQLLLATWGALAPQRATRPEDSESVRRLARTLLAALPWIIAPARWPRAASPAHSIAERVCILLNRAPLPECVRLAALVLTADHELNVSSFTARVVASSGADLYAVLSAAAGALSGWRHGTASEAVEALVKKTRHPRRARRIVDDCIARGEALTGFGHRFYPSGDPRGRALFALARELAPHRLELRTLDALCATAERRLGEHPTVDVALYATALALGAPSGTATALFALGRAAGLVAHALEQYRSGVLIRPRARYVGRRAP